MLLTSRLFVFSRFRKLQHSQLVMTSFGLLYNHWKEGTPGAGKLVESGQAVLLQKGRETSRMIHPLTRSHPKATRQGPPSHRASTLSGVGGLKTFHPPSGQSPSPQADMQGRSTSASKDWTRLAIRAQPGVKPLDGTRKTQVIGKSVTLVSQKTQLNFVAPTCVLVQTRQGAPAYEYLYTYTINVKIQH